MLEASANARVLKAQLLMIHRQGIDPRTCPAFSKFRLMSRLRRWLFCYFCVHTFVILTQMIRMHLWQRIAFLLVWELAQLATAFLIGLLFRRVAGRVNMLLEREAHLPHAQVAHPLGAPPALARP